MLHRLFYFIDRRSQLLCSTARVVSVGLNTDDEPSLADDNEETLLTSHPGTRTPQAAFVRDLGWDEDEPVISAYPSLQRPVHIFNESHREVQPPRVRGHVSTDERTPLLSRVSDAPSTPRHPPNSVPPKPTAIGQSTFSQTVSRALAKFIVFDVFGQLFNATALLLGIGMLSEPLAFSYAGWICGTLLVILYGIITCYTYVTLLSTVPSIDPN
jgi:vesicular inhibitory amino acid transporter